MLKQNYENIKLYKMYLFDHFSSHSAKYGYLSMYFWNDIATAFVGIFRESDLGSVVLHHRLSPLCHVFRRQFW